MDRKHFNVRVYGILIQDNRLLINEELIRGQTIIKFPGGGLDWGEGTVDCLVREWKEELGIDIRVSDHFYTTDFFQHSAFNDTQVISIYYQVAAKEIPQEIVNYVENERTYWIPMDEVSADTFTLPIDRKVGEMLGQLRLHKAL